MIKLKYTVCLMFLSSCSIFGMSRGMQDLWHTSDSASVSAAWEGIANREIFFASRSPGLIALRRADGQVVWRSSARTYCSGALLSGPLVVCAGGTLTAYDAETGTARWSHPSPSDSTFSQSQGTADSDRVYVSTMRRVVVVEAATGRLLWEKGFGSLGPLAWIRSLTLSPEGDLFVAVEARQDGNRSAAVVAALDPATGTERWRFRDDGPDGRSEIGGISFFENLMLYSDASGGQVVAVDRATRRVVWRAPGGGILSLRPPDIVDGMAYWASADEHLYAADARTGAVHWRVRPRRGSFVNHAACGRYVVGASIHDLWAVRRADGATVGRLVDGPEVGQLTVADDVLYVSTTAGVTAYNCR